MIYHACCDVYILMTFIISSCRFCSLITQLSQTLIAKGDSSLVRRVICLKRIGLGLVSVRNENFGIRTTPFQTNDPSDKWPVTIAKTLAGQTWDYPQIIGWRDKFLTLYMSWCYRILIFGAPVLWRFGWVLGRASSV